MATITTIHLRVCVWRPHDDRVPYVYGMALCGPPRSLPVLEYVAHPIYFCFWNGVWCRRNGVCTTRLILFHTVKNIITPPPTEGRNYTKRYYLHGKDRDMDSTAIAAIALSSVAIITSIIAAIMATIATRAAGGTTTPGPVPVPGAADSRKAYVGIVGFVLAIIGFCTSSGLISSALTSSSSWSSIQGHITGFTVLMMLGGAFMVVATACFMLYAYDYSHIFLAILTALAFGLSSTALAVTSISTGHATT